MIYKIGTMAELSLIENAFPVAVFDCAFDCVGILDDSYGAERNYLSSGGYVLIADSDNDIEEVKKIIDVDSLLCEWFKPLDGDYISALYLLGDDYAIVLIVPNTYIDRINSLP